MMVPNCHQPFLLHWNAQVGKILGRPEGESVYRRSCTYLTAGMVLVGVVLSLFIRPVMALIAAPAFYGAARLVPALVAAYVIRAIGAHLQSVFIAEGRPGLDARVSGVGAAVCIAGYAVLIPWLKLWGAVLATLLGFVTILIYGAYVAQRLRRSALEYGRMLRIGATGCVSVAGYYLVPLAHFWQEIGVGLLFLMGFVGWLFQWGLTAEERHDAKELLRNGIRKFNPWSLAQAA